MTMTYVIDVMHDPGRSEWGVWCSACALPSAVVLHFVGVTPHGVLPDLATMQRCTNCDPELFTEGEGPQ